MRVVIADDEVLLQQGLSRLLSEIGVEVTATAGDSPTLMRAVAVELPDVAIIDIKMPPTHTDEGLAAALAIREQYPSVAVLVLSHFLDSRYATKLIENHPRSVGYLLKERVSDIVVLLDALQRVAAGECVIAPPIVSRLLHRPRTPGRLDRLTDREREVLALMAEGHSNQGISERLTLSPRTVERHIGHIFGKLDLAESDASHRRVLAVLALLRT
ncbi:MAG: response regulator transcription factor [Geodermatophilaceae bacterium]|nr:response regulator transcription factor [Geodermatophilaceae bacterium]